jgi:release factor glutamine methyltransferase
MSAAIRALHQVATGRRVADDLRALGVDALVLKGPGLQQRLFGRPDEYRSGDVDVLVRPEDAAKAREYFAKGGWRPTQEAFWRLSRTTCYWWEQVGIDLHWGIHAGHLPARSFRTLEAELWRGAVRGPSGFLEPRLEPLLVYLALHAAGHGFDQPRWSVSVARCAELVDDHAEVERIAAECHAGTALRRALAVAKGAADPGHPRKPLLDGPVGAAAWAWWWVARGHAVPAQVRQPVREVLQRVSGGPAHARFAGLEIEVDRGVFWPARHIGERVVETVLELLPPGRPATVVEVGTGSGAIALAVAAGRPDVEVLASDLTSASVRCARRNAGRLSLRLTIRRGSLLDPWTDRAGDVDVVVANIPYIEPGKDDELTHDSWFPRDAVYGRDHDGLGLLRALARQALPLLRPGGWVVFQLAERQLDLLSDELRDLGYDDVDTLRRADRASLLWARTREAA